MSVDEKQGESHSHERRTSHDSAADGVVSVQDDDWCMPNGHVREGMHLEQFCEVRGSYGLGDQPQLWWRTFERCLEEFKFDQHQMDLRV